MSDARDDREEMEFASAFSTLTAQTTRVRPHTASTEPSGWI